MKDNLLSIEQASNRLRETLIKYIEATYHISDEFIIDQRNKIQHSLQVQLFRFDHQHHQQKLLNTRGQHQYPSQDIQ